VRDRLGKHGSRERMEGEIITIGSELISGRTLDFNAWYAAGRLTASGLRVTRITSVGDDFDAVSEALTRALAASRFVIVTGGLGATEDDMTSEIVARALDRPLCLDKEMFSLLKSYTEDRGIRMTPSLEKMAWMPDGSRMLNPEGRACGFALTQEGVRLYFLPGVPDQMRYLMDKYVIPELLDVYSTLPVIRQRVLKVFGLNEPGIAELFRGLKGEIGDVVLGFYPRFPENHVTLSLRGADEDSVSAELDRVEKNIRALLGAHVFGSENDTMAGVVGEALLEKGFTLGLAESCTGGLIGHLVTETAGSSRYYRGGVMAYSDEVKATLLGVSRTTLERDGAVSEATIKEMAQGVRRLLDVDLAVAVSGIAGPGGGTEAKPVGTVHLGLSVAGETLAGRYRFWGTREQVKRQTAYMALDWVRRYLHGDPFLPGS